MTEKVTLYCNRIIALCFYALFFFVPLVVSNTTSELFEFNKMWLTYILVIIMAGAWGTKMIVEKKFRIQRTFLDIPLLLFLFSQCISTLFSLDTHISLWGYYSRFNGGLLSILCYIFLYYAFVSNVDALTDTDKSKHLLTINVRSIIYAAAFLLIPFGIALAKPVTGDTTSHGAPIVLWFFIWCSFFLFVWTLPRDFFKKLLFITLTSGVVVALWGLPSHFGKDPTCLLFRGSFDVTCWTSAFQPTVRAFSTLGQPAWYVAYLSVLVLVAAGVGLAYFVTKQRVIDPKQKHLQQQSMSSPFPHASILWMLYAAAMLFYIDLIFGNTKAGFIGFWVGNVVFWGIVLIRKLIEGKQLIKQLLIFNLTLVILTFFCGAPIDQIAKYTLPVLHNQSKQSVTTPSTQAATSTATQASPGDLGGTDSGAIRLLVWKGAIAAWKDHLIFGTGVETFAFAYYKYRPAAHNMTSEWDYLYNKAHNEYLNYLTTTGIFGLGSYLIFILLFFFIALKWLFEHHDETEEEIHHFSRHARRLIIAGILGGYVTMLISNFFGFSVVIINLFIFVMPGWVLYLTDKLNKENVLTLPKVASTQKRAYVDPYQWTGIAGICIIVLILVLNLHNSWEADKAYALGSNLLQVGATDAQNLRDAFTELTNASGKRPSEPVFKDELALANGTIVGALDAKKNATIAGELAQQAQSLSDQVVTEHPNNIVFWKDRVRLFYLLSQANPAYLKPALEAIQKAASLAPTDAKIWYNVGVLYGQNGDTANGIKTLQHVITLKPDYRDAYYALGLFYHDEATTQANNGASTDAEQKAVSAMHYILDHLSPKDPEVLKTLKSWGEK